MAGDHILNIVAAIFGVALLVAWLFRVVRVPSIIGFLITGIAIGPSGWRLVPPEEVGAFSELGLVLLLFTIGLELSPEPLLRSGRRLGAAALLQVGATVLMVVAILSLFTTLPLSAQGILGIAVALSSTAIVLKQMSDRGDTHSSTGTITTGILLIQDVIVIVVMLLMSMATTKGSGGAAALVRAGGGLAGLAAIVLAARRFLPWFLDQIVRHGGRELMTLFAVVMACGGAWLAHAVDWSPALGACIAGLLLASADQRHQLVAEIAPFRDVFNAVFFIAMGMLVNLDTFFGHLPLLVVLIAATLVIKPAVTAGAVRVAGWPLRIGLQVGVGLCTVSEFSYVLAHQAQQASLLPGQALDLLVAYTVGTMMFGALLYPAAAPLAHKIALWLRPERPPDEGSQGGSRPSFANHVILVGHGFTGTNLAQMLRATDVPHCIIEMDHSKVKAAREAGTPVVIGDATRGSILEHAGIDTARALVVAVNDNLATERIVAKASARRPGLYLLARTNFLRDIDRLYGLGAKLVVPQDFETSIEIAAHILKQFGIPDNVVEAQIAAIRSGGYGLLRGKPSDRASHAEVIKILERTATQTYYLAEDSPACHRTLVEINLRARTGCSVIAVVRSGKATTSPAADFVLKANDVLVLVGAHQQIEDAKKVLAASEEDPGGDSTPGKT